MRFFSRSRSLRTYSAVLLLGLMRPAPCQAEPTATDRAVELAYQGRAQFEAGHFREALTLFQEAASKAEAPTLDLYIARCHKALGEWISALSYYERSVRSPKAPENVAWTSAQKSAELELEELRAKIPRLTLRAPHIRGKTSPIVTVDDREVVWPLRSRELDPGKHVIVSRYLGQEDAREVLAVAGEELTIELPFADPSVVPESPRTPPEKEVHVEDARRSLSPWFWGSTSLAGVGLAAGSITGIFALTTASEVRAFCEEALYGCPNNTPSTPEMQDKSQLSRTLGDVSTVSFIAAGAFAATAITLFILEPRGGERTKVLRTSEIRVQPFGAGLSVHSVFH